jgi:DNA-binding NtrC family response regulator
MNEKPEILIIDDEEIVCKRLKRALEGYGYAVEVFQEGQAGIDRIHEKQFDVVVSDVRIDEVDGLDVLDAVRSGSAETQIIMITGYATAELAREAQAKGAFDVIAKPFRPKDLKKLIEKAIRHSSR